MNRDEALGGLILFFFGVVTVLLSLRMSIGTFRAAGTGLFPLCLGILLMVLSAAFLWGVRSKAKKGKGAREARPEEAGSTGQMVFFLGAMVLATAFFNTLGYPLTSFLLLLALLRILRVRSWRVTLALSFLTAVASYFLFVQWLQIPLPKGFLGL